MKTIIKQYLLVVLIVGVFSSCKTQAQLASNANNDYLLMATLFQQKAAERRALSYQAFNMATLMLNNQMRMAGLTKTLAVIVDIDETVLDNSPFETKSILANSDYPKYWNEWCELANAEPLAGSVEFLNYAKAKGVVVFYITNRKMKLLEPTLKNLEKKGFPFADKDHVLMRTNTSSKESRRNIVKANHHIFLMMGDNLGDFTDEFDNKNTKERFALTDRHKDDFGRRFIVLPNPMYGSWVNDLFNNNFDLSKKEKIELFKKQLKAF